MALTTLLPYQREALNSVEDYIAEFSRLPTFLQARRHGKSLMTQTFTTNVASAAIGKNADMLVVDEWLDIRDVTYRRQLTKEDLSWSIAPPPGPEHVFDDPKWPGSRIEVWRKETGRRDPRHPNPKAGRIITYEIRGQEAEGERPIQNLGQAIKRAEMLHKRAVRRLQERLKEQLPNFGRF